MILSLALSLASEIKNKNNHVLTNWKYMCLKKAQIKPGTSVSC
jgi:hypothetical protein